MATNHLGGTASAKTARRMETPRARTWPSKHRMFGAAYVALVVLGAGARSADAEEATAVRASPVALEWSASPICSDAAHVLDEIERILGEGSGPRKTVEAHVGVEKEGGEGWRVTLTVRADGASRTRTFEAESCSAAKDAVALILAIEVDPQVAMRAPVLPLASNPPPVATATADTDLPLIPSVAPASPLPLPTPAVEAQPASSTKASAASPEPGSGSRIPLRGIAAASLALDSGSLPNLGVGANVALGVQIGHLRVELEGTYWGRQSAVAPEGPAGANFQLWSGAMRAGYLFGFGRFSLGPLVGAGFERMGAHGFDGTQGNANPTEVWGVLGAGGLALFRPVAHFAVRLVAEGELPLFRPTFVVENPGSTADTVHRPSAALGRATLGVEVDFP